LECEDGADASSLLLELMFESEIRLLTVAVSSWSRWR
jgi:hypothetical protein